MEESYGFGDSERRKTTFEGKSSQPSIGRKTMGGVASFLEGPYRTGLWKGISKGVATFLDIS